MVRENNLWSPDNRLQVSARHSCVKIVFIQGKGASAAGVRRSVCHNHCPHLQVVTASSCLLQFTIYTKIILGFVLNVQQLTSESIFPPKIRGKTCLSSALKLECREQ